MASTAIYPPNLPSYIPAFLIYDDCRIAFTLSDINMSTEDIQGIHVSIVKQSTGKSVINKNYNNPSSGCYGGSGILIVNTILDELEYDIINNEKIYYLDINLDQVTTGDEPGWGLGWIYKIQIRFSAAAYDESIGQTAWLNLHASDFSEWSTFCITKAIGGPNWNCPLANSNKVIHLNGSTLNFTADYTNEDISEILYNYQLRILLFSFSYKYNESDPDNWYDEEQHAEILEETNIIYTNQYYNPNQIQYNFKTKFLSDIDTDEEISPGVHLKVTYSYLLDGSYTTLNKFNIPFADINNIDPVTFLNPKRLSYAIRVEYSKDAQTPVQIITTDIIESVSDQDFKDNFNSQTFLAQEEEEGRIGLKLYLNDDTPSNNIFIITRADSKDNFQSWIDIKWVFCNNTIINDLPMFYDYTIESGIWYKYSVQTYRYDSELGVYIRGEMNTMAIPILREFEFAYLIGEGGRQLKLKYDNTMNSYTYNFSDGKNDTIGGQYPFITRNGNLKYRTIPINGLISFNMDEQELFTTDLELYKYPEIVTLYQNRHKKYHYYDYIKERDFREAVLAFLQDGKPKLFKSTTEGNLIIRLMTVAAQPNQTLNRMIYSFTATGHEVADATMENYLKYKFYSTGEEDLLE